MPCQEGSEMSGELDARGLLDEFIEFVGTGEFYQDYDRSTEMLGKARRALAALAFQPATTTCFECNGPLHAPYCPTCRPASPPAPLPEAEPVAWMHPNGAIWRADNYPAGMDFSTDGWIPLLPAAPQHKG